MPILFGPPARSNRDTAADAMTLRTAARWRVLPFLAALIGAGMLATRCSVTPEGDHAAEAGRAAAGEPLPAKAPVDEFLVFASTPGGRIGDTGPDYIATGLRRLAGALDSLDIGGDELALDLRVAAAHVLLQPASLENAALVRQLAIRTAQALSRGPSGAPVASRADAISDERSLLQQPPALQDFFAAAGNALAARREETAR